MASFHPLLFSLAIEPEFEKDRAAGVVIELIGAARGARSLCARNGAFLKTHDAAARGLVNVCQWPAEGPQSAEDTRYHRHYTGFVVILQNEYNFPQYSSTSSVDITIQKSQ